MSCIAEGNSPSQTEVKIISCIPIDVVDLQKQIESLETALREANKQHNKPAQVCCRRECKLIAVSCSRELETIDYIQTPELPPDMESYEFSNRKTRPGILSNKNPKKKKTTYEEDYTRGLKKDLSAKKSSKKKFWHHSHPCAYYAQTMNINPLSFSDEDQVKGNVSRKVDHVDVDVNCPYWANILRKQYQSGILFDDNVSSGAISVPICHDSTGLSADSRRRPSDTQDTYMPTPTYVTTTDASSILNLRAPRCYYDEQFYDVIPVKEKSEKKHRTPKEQELCQEYYTSDSIKLSVPDYSRPILRVTLSGTRLYHHRRHRKRDKLMKQMSGTREKRRRYYYDPCVANHISTTLPVGTKTEKDHRGPKHTAKKHSHKNRRSRQHTQCQTETAQQNVEQNVELLNQIKSILQTVLTEVKSSTLSRNSCANTRKDVFVQKGLSGNDMRVNSSFIRSYNYTPYESYILPAPQPRPPPPYPQSNICGMCCPMLYQPPYVYPSNAQYPPIILQHASRPTCSLNQPPIKTHPSMNIASTSTNTDSASTKLEESNKIGPETKQLIKDIYKTLTVNMPGIDSGKTFPTGDDSYKKFKANQSESETMKMADARNAEIESRSIENSQYRQASSSASDSESEATSVAIQEMHHSSGDTSSTVSRRSAISVSAPSESTLTPLLSKIKKKGRIGKMLNAMFKKKVNNKENASDDEDSSESDDNQTVYSQKVTISESTPTTRKHQPKNDTSYTVQHSAPIQYPVYQRRRVAELYSGIQSHEDDEAEATRRRVRFMQEAESTDAELKKISKTGFPWFKCRMDSWKQFILES